MTDSFRVFAIVIGKCDKLLKNATTATEWKLHNRKEALLLHKKPCLTL